MNKTSAIFHPIIGSIQKIALYETKTTYYLVGSNNTQTRFRVLRIDRTDPRELNIYDDKIEYGESEIRDLIKMNDTNVTYAFGIVGFICFLEGYYIILVTKRRRVAAIGFHSIYKIESTSMIYIPHESVRSIHSDEPRYLKMFQSVDLSSNFYFSYSYDITHTLQHNLSCPKRIIPNIIDEKSHPLSQIDDNVLKTSLIPKERQVTKETPVFGIRNKPHRKFVWNAYLLEKIEKELHPDWLLYIIQGFIDQTNVIVYGRSIYVTLIARRSCKYAGTRFLKRGANFQGDVANEVETEQMVHDSGVSSLSERHFTSFVQMRGSIPGHWRQEMGKMVAKPTITIDLYDPYAQTAGAHFNELLKRYGAPIIILNLVKRREHKKQEKLLSNELNTSIKYLNQFLPPEYRIIYKTFDMARKNKINANVMGCLAGIAKNAVMKTGIFHNQKKYFLQNSNTFLGQRKGEEKFSLQTGIVRTNCVDCLDRTNTAQFAIGKCVLGYQLCALGILDSPDLEFDTDCVRMLESLYEDHGDTLALQYGGSQLVHRVKTYRKTAPWTSQGNDIMQTLSRYYSNTFSDAEKQNAINLFLGLFIPDENKPQIWEYTSDYYFHHNPLNSPKDKSLSQWWDTDILKCLPYAYNDLAKACSEIIRIHQKDAEMIDAYSDYHRPYELSILSEVFAYEISNSIRDFMPNATTNYSPFTLRIRPGKRHEQSSNKNQMKNPSLTGQSSTSSTASSSSSGNNTDSSDNESSLSTNESQMSSTKESAFAPITFQALFPSMLDVYGTEPKEPKNEDVLTYKKYVLIGRRANGTARRFISSPFNLLEQSTFPPDTSIEVSVPRVSEESENIYKRYIETGINGGFQPNNEDKAVYMKYASFK